MLIHPGPETANRFLTFVNASPTPFHAVANAGVLLENAGFRKIREKDEWEKNISPGEKYYFTRNQSSLVAFTIPPKWVPGTGLSIVATHVDSPNLKIRPISKRTKSGYLQLGIETYGGGIWHTWFDRDLSVAGRVVVSNPDGSFTAKLLKIDQPILRIPTLAIHLNRDVNTNLKFNQETEFVPILGQIATQLNLPASPGKKKDEVPDESQASDIQCNHHPALLSLLSRQFSITPDRIRDFDISLYDTQPSVLGGLSNEFIFSPRLDNIFSSWCAVNALAGSKSDALSSNINCIALFNHEEVGSVSSSGAESSLIPSLLHRLSPTASTLAQSVSRSFLVSADMTHAIHPNYTAKYEENHAPQMNGGIVIKTNAKQKYTSDAVGSFIVRQLVHRKGGNVQEYETRNDMTCGSTVGPMLSKIGMRTVDVGCAMLSMHSIREVAGSHDLQHAIDLFTALFENFVDIDQELSYD